MLYPLECLRGRNRTLQNNLSVKKKRKKKNEGINYYESIFFFERR